MCFLFLKILKEVFFLFGLKLMYDEKGKINLRVLDVWLY